MGPELDQARGLQQLGSQGSQGMGLNIQPTKYRPDDRDMKWMWDQKEYFEIYKEVEEANPEYFGRDGQCHDMQKLARLLHDWSVAWEAVPSPAESRERHLEEEIRVESLFRSKSDKDS